MIKVLKIKVMFEKKVLKFNILYFRKLNGSTKLRKPDGQQ